MHAGELGVVEADLGDRAGSPGTKLMTPSGMPASRRIWNTNQLERIAVCDGFQTTVLPISAGAVGRLPPMAVKLNGVTA